MEDVGVEANESYVPDTIDDVIAGNPGLIRRACELLRSSPVRRVDIGEVDLKDGGAVTVTVKTVNIDSLRFYLDGILALTCPVSGETFSIPAVHAVISPRILRVEGFAGDSTKPLRAQVRSLQQTPAPVLSAVADPVSQSITGT